jgi:NAD(P)H-flavin reductase
MTTTSPVFPPPRSFEPLSGSWNIYEPYLMTADDVVEEAPGIRTLRLLFQDEEIGRRFAFRTGQFGEYSIFGAGECTFCIASSAKRPGYIECSFQKVGRVTTALYDVEKGDTIGFRGPYGNWFPLEKMEGRSIVFIGMGIGLAPVRSAIWTALDERNKYESISIIYGARSSDVMVYKRELEAWAQRSDIRFVKTVDPGGEPKGWDGEVGFVPTVVDRVAPSPQNTYAIICGPPIGIKFTLPILKKLGFPPERIYTTLENRMKCGLGKCGRCNVGGCYVCKDGPVFTVEELEKLPAEY